MITLGEARVVLEDEVDALRFERFCNELVTLMLGRPILGTTASGDLGVDGRAIQLDALSEDFLIAAATRRDVTTKMEEDAKRIRDTQKSGSVYFCSSKTLNEARKAAARKKLKAILGPTFGVTLLTQEELADAATRYVGPLERQYATPIQELRDRVAERMAAGGGTLQLQIAHTLTSEEGFANRETIADFLVVEVIARGAATANEVTVQLQALLRLPSTFPSSVVVAALSRLAGQRLLREREDGRFEASDGALAQRHARLEEAREREAETRMRLAESVTSRLGYALDAKQYDLLWQQLMRGMSELLTKVGARFAAVVEAARTHGDLSEVKALASESIRVACHTAVASIRKDTVREEAEEALYGALVDEADLAIEWLQEIVAAWLTACQLGLVPEISQKLEPAVRKLVLALDTDVVLSLLSEAEPDNGAITDLLGQWNILGGRTYIAPEVLGEVAHHAWIARVEFSEIASIVRRQRYDPGLARHIARNAFVRAYWSAGRPATPSDFERFIRSFAGERPDDTRAVESTLGRYSIGQRLLSPTAAEMSGFRQLEPRVRTVLARTLHFAPSDPSGGAIAQDKMDRDASAIVRYAAVAHSSPASIESLLLLTSSKRLRIAIKRAATSANVVVSTTSTLGLLLAAAYSRQARPLSIAQLLLAEGAHAPVRYLRSELLRMIARADLLNALPRARMVTLEREVESGILDYARRSSRSRAEVRREVLNASEKGAALDVLAEAIRKSAIGADVERVMRAQAEEIERLRAGRAPNQPM